MNLFHFTVMTQLSKTSLNECQTKCFNRAKKTAETKLLLAKPKSSRS